MKNIQWVLGTILVSVLIAVGISYVLLSHSAKFGAITSPATELGYVNLEQALGFGPNVQPQGSQSLDMTATRMSMVAATNTPCAMQNPFSGTSTVEFIANITTATSTSGLVTVATSSTAFATTTSIATPTIGANNQQTIAVEGPAASQNTVVGPAGWIVMGVQGATYPFTYGGTCSALWISAN